MNPLLPLLKRLIPSYAQAEALIITEETTKVLVKYAGPPPIGVPEMIRLEKLDEYLFVERN